MYRSSSDCYCGSAISNQSTVTLNSLCSLPCPGDSNVSCGGMGYLVIYRLISAISFTKDFPVIASASDMPSSIVSTMPAPALSKTDSTLTSISSSLGASVPPTPMRTSTIASATVEASTHHDTSSTTRVTLAVSLSIGTVSLAVLVVGFLWWFRGRRTKRVRSHSLIVPAEEKGDFTAIQGPDEREFVNVLKRGGTIKGIVVQGKFTLEKDDSAHESGASDSVTGKDSLEGWNDDEMENNGMARGGHLEDDECLETTAALRHDEGQSNRFSNGTEISNITEDVRPSMESVSSEIYESKRHSEEEIVIGRAI